MFLQRINGSEIISHVKPEFAKYAKKVKYQPVESLSSVYFPRSLSDLDRRFFEAACVEKLKGNVDAQVLAARGAIENYAKHKHVTIDMARRISIVGETNPKLEDHIAVFVYNPRTRAREFAFVNVPEGNQTVKAVTESQRVFTNTDGVQVVRPVKSEYEDNFIRTLYRNIEDAVKRSSKR